jgi:phosphoribosylaminoimidazole-succinocarboxamide synthase
VCGISLPAGLLNASALAEPIFTPATKAAVGEHDENVSFETMAQALGQPLAEQVRQKSIELYTRACAIAAPKGILIADTKFEFGLDEHDQLVLMDEVLTPDSSRYWPKESYQAGHNPPSFDKQFLRDWLESVSIQGKPWNKKAPAPTLSQEVIDQTAQKYQEVWERLSA